MFRKALGRVTFLRKEGNTCTHSVVLRNTTQDITCPHLKAMQSRGCVHVTATVAISQGDSVHRLHVHVEVIACELYACVVASTPCVYHISALLLLHTIKAFRGNAVHVKQSPSRFCCLFLFCVFLLSQCFSFHYCRFAHMHITWQSRGM